MDTEYLKSAVGEALGPAIALTVASNPSDPIDFLARLLLKHVSVAESEKTVRVVSCERSY
jgi:uncharacterized protein (DUF39 family)